jgi:hypothetical protein
MAASILLCAEDSSSILGLGAEADEEVLERGRTRGEPGVEFPVPSEECVDGFVEAEAAHMPREDYAERLPGRTTPRGCAPGAWISVSGRTPSTGFGRCVPDQCSPYILLEVLSASAQSDESDS